MDGNLVIASMDFIPRDFATESRAPQILIGNIIPQVFSTTFVLARMYTRCFLIRSWGADDTAVAIAWLASLSLTLMNCIDTHYGVGQHFTEVPASNLRPLLQIAYGTLIVYNITLSLTKISICLFYLRIFPDQKSRRIIFATMAFIVLYTLPLEGISIFQCHPVDGVWEVAKHARCLDTLPAFYTSTTCNVLVDVWLIGFVVPRIVGLNMAGRSRGVLLFVVSMGWLVVAAALIRVIRISLIKNDLDRTWVSYDTSIWTGLEVTIGIFCVSAPTIKPFLTMVAPGLMSYLSGSENSSWIQNSNDKKRTTSGSGSGKGKHIELENRGRYKIQSKALLKGGDYVWGENITVFSSEVGESRENVLKMGREEDFESRGMIDVDIERGDWIEREWRSGSDLNIPRQGL